MDFRLSEDQLAFQETARDFARSELLPHAAGWDEGQVFPVEALRKAVHHRVLEAVGLPARDVMLVKSGTLPKTSSGKLQRSLCRQQYLDETLQLA